MLLITGGSGFLGSHLINKSKEQKRNILHPSSTELNLLRFEDVNQYVNDNKIKKIIHAAGYVGGIGLHEDHPARVASDNLEMGMNIIRASSNKKCKAHNNFNCLCLP